jgi:hypothetical protein
LIDKADVCSRFVTEGGDPIQLGGPLFSQAPFACCGGVGVILTLHHVRPARAGAFQPNRSLEISPEFFDTLITEFRRQGLEFISLDEMHRRLTEGRFFDRFVCITFDDGYRDNAEYAYPILRYHQVPFAIFVASDFADWRGHLVGHAGGRRVCRRSPGRYV